MMNNASIVCIDDEKFILDSLRGQLLRNFRGQFTVEIAENGAEALALLDELSAAGVDIPLVICDQIMPNISGDQLLCKIHQKYPKIFKILLTGIVNFDSIINTVNHANLYRYISKPWDETDLNLAVREAMRSYFQDQQLEAQNLKLRATNERLQKEISERKQAESKLLHLALHDTLTGLHNRKFFVEQLDLLLEESKKNQPVQFAVMFIDLDRFKLINDSLGHDVGDQLLIAISNRLKNCIRATDIVARLGGDEFTILLNPITSIYDATEIAERILSGLSTPFNLNGQQFSASASIGILEGSIEYTSSISLLRDADTAMYSAKNNGKSRYSIFKPDMHSQTLQLWRLESALQTVLENNELFLEYQPILSLETGKLKGLEALVRWQHPTKGLISPGKFIPIAEDSGMMLIIGEWILQEVCHQLKDWHTRFPHYSSLGINVNFSSQQIHEFQCVETIDRILTETGLEGKFLTLELTEGTLIPDTELTIYTLQKLRDRHINLSIDDFGKGYSSLSYLHRLPINSLKIDRLFTQQIDHRPESLNIIRGIISLAHSLGLAIVVEGIETAQQIQAVKNLGCELGQGHFLAPPLSCQAVEEWLLTP